MASPQESADSIRAAIRSQSAWTVTTTTLLSNLLIPKAEDEISAPKKTIRPTAFLKKTPVIPTTGRAKSRTAILEDTPCNEQLSAKERSILATEVINATLKSLSDAIKTSTTCSIRRQASSKDSIKSNARKGLRRSNSLPQTPLQSRSLNRVASSPNIANRESRSSSSASSTPSPHRPTAECARIAFACLRALANSKSQRLELPTLQLENGMSALVGKLVALGMDDLAIKELRTLKRRLETPEITKKGPGSRQTTTTISQTLAELLNFGHCSYTGARLGLIITTQLQVLRLMTSARKPKQVEEALPTLDPEHASSPIRLLLISAKEATHSRQNDKVARQIQTLSELLLSLGPGVSTSEDSPAQEPRLSVSPEAALKLQCLALNSRFLWWGLVGHKGDLAIDIFEPFLKCLQAFARRSPNGATETYQIASSMYNDIEIIVKGSQSRALTSTLQGIYRLLSSLSRDANLISDSTAWTEEMHKALDAGLDSETKRCSVIARLASLTLRKSSWDSKDEGLLLELLDGLERPFKGEAPEIDELMLEVSSARRFAVIALSKSVESRDHEHDGRGVNGMRDMCEQLIYLCPRLCLRYLSATPDMKSTTKDVVRHEQRRKFVTKPATHAIDSVLFLVKIALGAGRLTWDLVDSKLQDCLLLLDRIHTSSSADDNATSVSYYVRISNLYYSQFLDMRRNSGAKDGQQMRALRRSLDSIRARPQSERKTAQFTTKLERMAEFCKVTSRYDELDRCLKDLRDEMISEGVLFAVVEQASYHSMQRAWTSDEQSTVLGRTIQSITKVQIRHLRSTDILCMVDNSWSSEEKAAVLEHQLDFLAQQPYSDLIARSQVAGFRELLSIYDSHKYPVRRMRTLLRLLAFERSDYPDLAQYMDELDNPESIALIGSQDEGLVDFLVNLQNMIASSVELRNPQPDVEKLKKNILDWTSILTQCKDFSALQRYVDDVPYLLVQLDTIANWLQMKGYGPIRVPVLRLVADIQGLPEGSCTPDDLILSLTTLGSQWLQLGYSAKAISAFDRAKSYSTHNGVTPFALLQLELSFCDYWVAVGKLELGDKHMSAAQAIYWQNHNVLERTNSTLQMQQKIRQSIMSSNAYAMHSLLAIGHGESDIALNQAKKSVRLLRRAWYKLDSVAYYAPKAEDNAAQTEVENLRSDLNNMSLRCDEKSLNNTTLPESAPGINLWALITPLFQGLVRLSELFAHNGMFQETIYYAEQAYKLAAQAKSESLVAIASVLLGRTWLKAGSLDKGSEYLMYAKSVPTANHKSRDMAILEYHIASMHGLLGDSDAEHAAYVKADNVLNILMSSDHINILERITYEPSAIEDEMSKLTPNLNKPSLPKNPTGRSKPTSSTKKIKMPRDKKPLRASSTTGNECHQLLALKGTILRQRAKLLMMTRKFYDAAHLLEEAGNYTRTRSEQIDHNIHMGRQLLLQSLEQMNVDPVYSVLQDSTISFPSVARGAKTDKPAERLSSSKPSPSRKAQVARGTRDRNGSKSPGPDSFVGRLQKAQEHLLQAHTDASKFAPVAVAHTTSALLNSVTILLSAAGQVKGKIQAHPGLASSSIETARTEALRRERQAILSELRMVSKTDETWPPRELPKPNVASPQQELPKGDESGHKTVSEVLQFRKNYIDIIPESWSVISISLSETRHELCITKLRAGTSPFILRLPLGRHNSIDADEEEFGFEEGQAELLEIIELANETAHDARNRTGKDAKTAWWEEREALDTRLRDLLGNIEKVWLGGFTGIFSQHTSQETLFDKFEKSFHALLDKHLPSRKKKGRKNTTSKITLDPRILELFIGLGDPSDEACDLIEPLTDLLYFVVDVLQFQGELNEYSEIEWDSIVVDLQDVLSAYHRAVNVSSYSDEGKHTILILDKALHAFPWESLPCMEGLAVSRLPSLGCLKDRLDSKKHESSPEGPEGHYINRSSGSYILNPGSDLKETQKTFLKPLQSLGSWQGTTSHEPSEEEFKESLTSKDLMLYFGHGSGAQYIRAREIKRLEKCAVTFLMGCSSGQLIETGEFEPYGSPINYMHAGAPALVATLWDVTDKDIDRFAKSAFEHWGLFEAEKVGKGKGRKGKMVEEEKGKVSLVEAVAKGREACHLKYLNAASVVVYGIPVYFR